MKLAETFFFGYLELKWRRLAKFTSSVGVAIGYGVLIYTDDWGLEFGILVILSPLIIAVFSWLLKPFIVDNPHGFNINNKGSFSAAKLPKSTDNIIHSAPYQKEVSKLYPYVSYVTLIIIDVVSFLIVFALISNQSSFSGSDNSANINLNSHYEKQRHIKVEEYTFKDSIDNGWVQIKNYYEPDAVKLCKEGFEKGYDQDRVYALGINAGYGYSQMTRVLEFYESHRKFERDYGDLLKDCQDGFEKGKSKQAIIASARIRGYSEKSIIAALQWHENSLEYSIQKDKHGYFKW